MAKIYAVHFLKADMSTQNGVYQPWQKGEKRSVSEHSIYLCRRGFHYSHSWRDAAVGGWLYGPIACIVKVDDTGPKDATKAVSYERKLIDWWNIEDIVRDCLVYSLPILLKQLTPRFDQENQRGLVTITRMIERISVNHEKGVPLDTGVNLPLHWYNFNGTKGILHNAIGFTISRDLQCSALTSMLHHLSAENGNKLLRSWNEAMVKRTGWHHV